MVHRGRKNRFDLIDPPALRPVPAPNCQEPPGHLGEPERAIWGHVLSDYSFSTETSIHVLASALEAHQRAREAREAVEREGMTIVGRDGQPKAHPLLAVERDARAAWLAGLKALGLEL